MFVMYALVCIPFFTKAAVASKMIGPADLTYAQTSSLSLSVLLWSSDGGVRKNKGRVFSLRISNLD